MTAVSVLMLAKQVHCCDQVLYHLSSPDAEARSGAAVSYCRTFVSILLEDLDDTNQWLEHACETSYAQLIGVIHL